MDLHFVKRWQEAHDVGLFLTTFLGLGLVNRLLTREREEEFLARAWAKRRRLFHFIFL